MLMCTWGRRFYFFSDKNSYQFCSKYLFKELCNIRHNCKIWVSIIRNYKSYLFAKCIKIKYKKINKESLNRATNLSPSPMWLLFSLFLFIQWHMLWKLYNNFLYFGMSFLFYPYSLEELSKCIVMKIFQIVLVWGWQYRNKQLIFPLSYEGFPLCLFPSFLAEQPLISNILIPPKVVWAHWGDMLMSLPGCNKAQWLMPFWSFLDQQYSRLSGSVQGSL